MLRQYWGSHSAGVGRYRPHLAQIAVAHVEAGGNGTRDQSRKRRRRRVESCRSRNLFSRLTTATAVTEIASALSEWCALLFLSFLLFLGAGSSASSLTSAHKKVRTVVFAVKPTPGKRISVIVKECRFLISFGVWGVVQQRFNAYLRAGSLPLLPPIDQTLTFCRSKDFLKLVFCSVIGVWKPPVRTWFSAQAFVHARCELLDLDACVSNARFLAPAFWTGPATGSAATMQRRRIACSPKTQIP